MSVGFWSSMVSNCHQKVMFFSHGKEKDATSDEEGDGDMRYIN